MRLHELLAAGRARLVAAGITPQEAAVDAELFARTILGWDRARLLTELQAPAPPPLEPRFSEWIARRERREPAAYIVGSREFWGLDFHVTPDVLVPRPETEQIVETALELLGSAESPRVADVGTGSGCLAVAIAHSLPGARVVATDISGEALAIARLNAARHRLQERISFVLTSYLDGVSGPFDAIVSNPPYVQDKERNSLQREVVRYEPHVALFGGADGLEGVRAVVQAAARTLAANGRLLFEFGLGQDDEVREVVEGVPVLELIDFRSDLQGIPRTAVVRRRQSGVV